MEFPFGSNPRHHHDHRRNDDEEDKREYYPPPSSLYHQPPPYHRDNEFAPQPPSSHFYHRENEFAPPPPQPPSQHFYHESGYAPPPPSIQETHVYHTSHKQGLDSSANYQPPPPPPPPSIQETHVYHTSHNQGLDSSANYQPPPPITQVTHVSHESTETHHSYKPHLPSFIHHHTHQSGSASGLDLSNKPTFKVYCKAGPNFHLSIRDGKVILASADPSDEFQNWYKDEKYSTRVKDEEGCPCFALVNKATGQAMKHSVGATHPVQLIPYNPDLLDESILWTESKDLGDGHRAVRMVNNVHLNVDAFHGDKKSGGVHDGTIIVLWKWNKGDNQRWRITPQCKFLKKQNASNSCFLWKFSFLLTLVLCFENWHFMDVFNLSWVFTESQRCIITKLLIYVLWKVCMLFC